MAWDVAAVSWERNYAALRAFHEREDHADVPYHHVEGGLKLGRWLSNQRHRKRLRGMSDAERKATSSSTALSDEEMAALSAESVPGGRPAHWGDCADARLDAPAAPWVDSTFAGA